MHRPDVQMSPAAQSKEPWRTGPSDGREGAMLAAAWKNQWELGQILVPDCIIIRSTTDTYIISTAKKKSVQKPLHMEMLNKKMGWR